MKLHADINTAVSVDAMLVFQCNPNISFRLLTSCPHNGKHYAFYDKRKVSKTRRKDTSTGGRRDACPLL